MYFIRSYYEHFMGNAFHKTKFKTMYLIKKKIYYSIKSGTKVLHKTDPAEWLIRVN